MFLLLVGAILFYHSPIVVLQRTNLPVLGMYSYTGYLNKICHQYLALSCSLVWYTYKGLPVKTARAENGPSPKRPYFRLKRPQFSVKTAPYQKSSVKTAPNGKVSVVSFDFSINLNDLTSR